MISLRYNHNALVLLSPLKIREKSNGYLVLTRKFIDGVMKYVEYWPGQVVILAERTQRQNDSLDDVAVKPSELPFRVGLVKWSDPNIGEHLKNSRVVLCALDDWQQVSIPSKCVAIGVPVVCVTEYTYKTRRQIICSETTNPLKRLRRIWWTARLEKKRRHAVSVAHGVQCNGTPTFLNYQTLNRNLLLFFDSRIESSMLASDDVLIDRTRKMRQGEALRLAFSGRLVAMKGAHHLPRVAAELRRMKVPFTLDIFGDGVLMPKLKAQIEALNLGNQVHLRGVMDFANELIPTLSKTVDLFICCHPQGDPSCTYMETMACGVPIAGYANEAFEGLVKISGLGWTSPINEPKQLALLVANLNQNRQLLTEAAFQSRNLASQHTFTQVFQDRTQHLLQSAALYAVQ